MSGRRDKDRAFVNMSSSKRHTGIIVIIVLLCLLIALALIIAYKWFSSSKYNSKTMFRPKEELELALAPDAVITPSPAPKQMQDTDIDPEWIEYEGSWYKPNENVVCVLFYGIDTEKRDIKEEYSVNSYQADAIMIGVIDTQSRKMKVLSIPRDVTTPVKVLTTYHEYSRTEDTQLCLQHGYGDGGELSAQLMMDAVSTLLEGVPVNQYVSMDLNGIEIATDAVGGVELTLLEDFTAEDSHMRKDRTMTLNGKQARIYCQRRMLSSFSNTLNASRMQRQTQFCKAFVQTLKKKIKENPLFVTTLYDKMKQNISTNLNMDELLYLANFAMSMEFSDDIFEKLAVKDQSTEDITLVYPDKEAIQAQIISLFYEPVDRGA